jgi:hypothetical protein
MIAGIKYKMKAWLRIIEDKGTLSSLLILCSPLVIKRGSKPDKRQNAKITEATLKASPLVASETVEKKMYVKKKVNPLALPRFSTSTPSEKRAKKKGIPKPMEDPHKKQI